MQTDIVAMYVDDGLNLREIGDKIGFSRQTVCNILQDVGVRAAQKGVKPLIKKPVQNVDEIVSLYADEDKPVIEIAKLLRLSVDVVSESLRSQGVTIKKGGMRTIVFPELRKLTIGESLDLPRVGLTKRHTYVRYYIMAKSAGIKVSVRVISADKVKVTRKA